MGLSWQNYPYLTNEHNLLSVNTFRNHDVCFKLRLGHLLLRRRRNPIKLKPLIDYRKKKFEKKFLIPSFCKLILFISTIILKFNYGLHKCLGQALCKSRVACSRRGYFPNWCACLLLQYVIRGECWLLLDCCLNWLAPLLHAIAAINVRKLIEFKL